MVLASTPTLLVDYVYTALSSILVSASVRVVIQLMGWGESPPRLPQLWHAVVSGVEKKCVVYAKP